VAVAYSDLMEMGGAESVGVHALAALQDEYDVTLVTLVEPDFDAIEAYYDVAVDPSRVTVRRVGHLPERLVGTLGARAYVLKQALFARLVRAVADEYDLVVAAEGELPVDGPAVQYVHDPLFAHWQAPDRSVGAVQRVYDAVCRRLAGFDPDAVAGNVLVTNSEWSADQLAPAYGVRPGVVYPPVATGDFPAVPWEEREDGFVLLGRVAPGKGVPRVLEIIARLRDRGYDVHLHVVGPLSETDPEFVAAVREQADPAFVTLEGALDRESLARLLATHRYGIHGRENEAFGIAVAELLAAGTVPFVPTGGGQQEVVEDRPEVVYEGVDDAVETIGRVLSDPGSAERLRGDPDRITARFGRDRFAREFRDVVAATLAEDRHHRSGGAGRQLLAGTDGEPGVDGPGSRPGRSGEVNP
jgi:glycosyltransferase involved in cell wall biosynthesis